MRRLSISLIGLQPLTRMDCGKEQVPRTSGGSAAGRRRRTRMICFLCAFVDTNRVIAVSLPVRRLPPMTASPAESPKRPQQGFHPLRKALSEPTVVQRIDLRFFSARNRKRSPTTTLEVDEVSLCSSFGDLQKRKRRRLKRRRRKLERAMSTTSESAKSSRNPTIFQNDSEVSFERLIESESSSSSLTSSTNGSTCEKLRVEASPSKEAFITNGSLLRAPEVPKLGESLETLLMEEPVVPKNEMRSPEDQFDPVNYTDDIQAFVLNANLPSNVFEDPFEIEERRSRTEQWVERCSPMMVPTNSSDNEDEQESEDAAIGTQKVFPEVQIEAASGERSLGNEKDRELEEYVSDDEIEEKEDESSIVSSTLDKSSLKNLKFRSRLHLAMEQQAEVDIDNVERFWDYLYDVDNNSKELEKLRGVTPTVERVVTYFTHHGHTKGKSSREKPPTGSPQPATDELDTNTGSNADEHGIVADSAQLTSSEDAEAVNFFRLERITDNVHSEASSLMEDEDESEGGRVVIVDNMEPLPPTTPAPQPQKLKERLFANVATSTADLGDCRGSAVVGDDEGRRHFSGKHDIHSQTEPTHPDMAGYVSPNASYYNYTPSTEDLLSFQNPKQVHSHHKTVSFSAEPSEADAAERSYMRAHDSVSPTRSILKKEDEAQKSIRRFMQFACERLFKDLKLLVTERDRARSAIDILPPTNENLSDSASYFQTKYRQKIEDNKDVLDNKIDEIWKKLCEMPLTDEMAKFINVDDSAQLTMKVRRNLTIRVPTSNNSSFYPTADQRNDIEMASAYAERLAKVRAQMIRRDSESSVVDRRGDSIVDMMSRLSRALEATKFDL
ncbi:unnamed protein product [Caenorhabditis auriculariae]|uniref:Uncharacterized protein n=1 Tax=Caenorhabditis auriculariae TaxID=2777116 RepID=A0A8S1HL11_9PELO|nr:unnamed protein product [Caenorhabditis auriculariae]